MVNNFTFDPLGFLGGLIGGIAVIIVSLAILWYILLIIAGWKIFKKAGEAGWKSLIPFYNSYIFYKIVGMQKWFWVLIFSAIAVSLATSMMGFDGQNIMNNSFTGVNLLAFLLLIAEIILAIVIAVKYSIRTSKVFGHGLCYALGLIFLQNLFFAYNWSR